MNPTMMNPIFNPANPANPANIASPANPANPLHPIHLHNRHLVSDTLNGAAGYLDPACTYVLTGFVVGAVLAAAIFVIAWLCLRRKTNGKSNVNKIFHNF